MEQTREEYLQIIAEELKVFFGGLKSKATDLFPETDEAILLAKIDELRELVARFTFDVMIQYGRLLWKERQLPGSHPCRFHNMACKYMEGRYEGMAIRPLSETKRYFKMMWRALASTRFALTEKDRSLLRDAGLTPEYMDADTSLASFAQSINDFCCVHGAKRHNLDADRESFIKDRETIYDEFSQLWHIKTRTYMREIARCLGKEVRANPNATEEGYQSVVWKEAYQNARFKSRVNMTYKQDKNEYGGLFKDLVNGRGVAISAKACFGLPSPSKRQKLTRPLMPAAPQPSCSRR